MANTAFKGTMTIQHADGTIESDVFSNTDVSLVYCTWASNGGATFYTVRKDGFINGISLAIVAVDTTKYLKLYINQQDTGIKILQSTCFHTLAKLAPSQTPIPVKKDQQILLQAVT
jgi:hypothetical protein